MSIIDDISLTKYEEEANSTTASIIK